MKIKQIHEFKRVQKRPKLGVMIPSKAKRERQKRINDECADKLMICIDCVKSVKRLCDKPCKIMDDLKNV